MGKIIVASILGVLLLIVLLLLRPTSSPESVQNASSSLADRLEELSQSDSFSKSRHSIEIEEQEIPIKKRAWRTQEIPDPVTGGFFSDGENPASPEEDPEELLRQKEADRHAKEIRTTLDSLY